MIVNGKSDAVATPLMLDGSPLQYVKELKYLGLILRHDLSWVSHVHSQCAATQHLIRERLSRVAHTDLPLQLQITDCKSRCWTVLEYGMDSASATMSRHLAAKFEQTYMRACRALVHAGSSGRGLQNYWILQELGMPRAEARLDWIALRFYVNICLASLPIAGVTNCSQGTPCIPAGVRAVQFLMSSQRGLVWIETLRMFVREPMTFGKHWSDVDAVRTCRVLQSVGWAPKRTRRRPPDDEGKDSSGWVVDMMSSEEIASIQRAPARERGALEADESDPLVKALIRVLPITVRNILHIVSCVVRSELNPDTTSQGTIKRAMRNAIYEHHRVGDRKVALNVLQAHVSSMCVEVIDSMPAPAGGRTDNSNDHANPAVEHGSRVLREARLTRVIAAA